MLHKFLVGGLLVLIAIGALGDPHYYRRPGADPCAGACTLVWALSQTGWPAEVQAALREKVEKGTSQPYIMEAGWRGWMVGGGGVRPSGRVSTPRYYPEMVAADGVWRNPDHVEPAEMWMFALNGVTYTLLRVNVCSNWAGMRSDTIEEIVVTDVNKVPLGVVPAVTCN